MTIIFGQWQIGGENIENIVVAGLLEDKIPEDMEQSLVPEAQTEVVIIENTSCLL